MEHITFRQLINLFDNWNIVVVINDSNLKEIESDFLYEIGFNDKYDNYVVESFGFYDDELCVRVKTSENGVHLFAE